MTGWSVCPLCRAVVWRDVMSRTFGHAPGCANSKYTVANADPSKPSRGGGDSKYGLSGTRGVFAKRTGKALSTPYSSDARGDCRPTYLKGTGNFTISQASRFPPDKKAPGSGTNDQLGDEEPGFRDSIAHKASPTRKTTSAPFKDKGERSGPTSGLTPPTVGPSTYLKHNTQGLDGTSGPLSGTRVYGGGVGLNSKQPRDIYGPGGISNLGRVFSPKRVNAYVAHDHLQSLTLKTPGAAGKWSVKGRTFMSGDRFKKMSWEVGTPGPGDYHGELSRPYSSLNTKIQYRDPDAIRSHAKTNRPYTVGQSAS